MEFVTFCKIRENYAQGSQIYVKFMKETGLSEKIHLFAERCIFLCYTMENEYIRRIVMKRYVFGIDVGGTTVKLGLFSDQGELLEKWEIPTDTSNNGSNIIPDIASAIDGKLGEKQIEKKDVIGVGIGVPGPVDAKGYVRKCVNLGWGTFRLEEAVEQATGLRCKAANDANVATLGEMYKGCAREYRQLVMLTLGTGVGGGIIIDGKILPGSRGAAGEVGHMTVNVHETAVCGCGRKGCLEQYASANGIARVTALKLRETEEETVLRKLDKVTAKDIFDAAKAGDGFALRMVEQLGKTLGMACARIATVVDPEAFVFGGGVSRAGSILTDVTEKYYNVYAFKTGARFLLAELGNDAGIYGSAKLILDRE